MPRYELVPARVTAVLYCNKCAQQLNAKVDMAWAQGDKVFCSDCVFGKRATNHIGSRANIEAMPSDDGDVL